MNKLNIIEKVNPIIENFGVRLEESLRSGPLGWGWPFLMLVAALDIGITIKTFFWLSQFTWPQGITLFSLVS